MFVFDYLVAMVHNYEYVLQFVFGYLVAMVLNYEYVCVVVCVWLSCCNGA